MFFFDLNSSIQYALDHGFLEEATTYAFSLDEFDVHQFLADLEAHLEGQEENHEGSWVFHEDTAGELKAMLESVLQDAS